MKLRREASTLVLAVGATMAAGAVAPAQAVSMPFNLSETTGGPPASNTLSFDKFNPALGTLTGVVFTLVDPVTGTTALVSLSGGEGGTAFTTIQSSFDVSTLSGTQISGTGSAQTSCTASGLGGQCSGSSPGPGVQPTFSSPVTDTTDLGIYTGPSGFFDVFVSLNLTDTTGPNSCVGNETPTCTHSGTASWSGDLNVAFQFTPQVEPPVGVPEPATLPLLSAGLLGLGARLLGFGARRRRSAT